MCTVVTFLTAKSGSKTARITNTHKHTHDHIYKHIFIFWAAVNLTGEKDDGSNMNGKKLMNLFEGLHLETASSSAPSSSASPLRSGSFVSCGPGMPRSHRNVCFPRLTNPLQRIW